MTSITGFGLEDVNICTCGGAFAASALARLLTQAGAGPWPCGLPSWMALRTITGGLGRENLALWGPSPCLCTLPVIACSSSSRPLSSTSAGLFTAGWLAGLCEDAPCRGASACRIPAAPALLDSLPAPLDGLLGSLLPGSAWAALDASAMGPPKG